MCAVVVTPNLIWHSIDRTSIYELFLYESLCMSGALALSEILIAVLGYIICGKWR